VGAEAPEAVVIGDRTMAAATIVQVADRLTMKSTTTLVATKEPSELYPALKSTNTSMTTNYDLMKSIQKAYNTDDTPHRFALCLRLVECRAG
jgi:hypothetical protein